MDKHPEQRKIAGEDMKVIIAMMLIGIVLISGCTQLESQSDQNKTSENTAGQKNQGEGCQEINKECCMGDHCVGAYEEYCSGEEDEVVFVECDSEKCLPVLDCRRIGESPPPGKHENKTAPEPEETDPRLKLPSCNGNRVFTRSPIDTDDILSIYPLGGINPSGHTFPTDHIYIFIKNQIPIKFNSSTETEVYSPGDLILTSVSISEHVDLGYSDYMIHFSPCKEVVGYFIHLSSLSEELESILEPFDYCNEYSSGEHDYKNCWKDVDHTLSAGDLIGTAGMRGPLDLGVYDYRTTHEYANPLRWEAHDRSIKTVCPVDYFTQDVADILEPMFGSTDGETKSEEPACGTIYQDIAGTAQGIWFTVDLPEDSLYTFPEDPHLALVHDAVQKKRGILSVGTSGKDLPVGKYFFWPEATGKVNRDFGDILPGDVYCFETEGDWNNKRDDFTIILELVDDTNLKIEKRSSINCGSGPWSFSDPAEFKR
jgi:hypothetical protein